MTIDEARELVADAVLWPRVRDFLWDFAPQVHPSWLESWEVGKLESLKVGESESLGHPTPQLSNYQTVKRFILDSLDVEPCFHTFPKDDWSRLLLLDGATLEALAKWLGALVCAGELRKVTGGAKVRELKAALPGIYPEVFSYTAYFRELESRKVGESEGRMPNVEDSGSVICAGLALMQSFVAEAPAPLLHRLALKLPKDYSAFDLSNFDIPGYGFSRREPSSNPTLEKNLKLLLKLRFPEAHKLCC